jgi:peptidyl-prolyl cis-trans isomerase B (cyclophilin B)
LPERRGHTKLVRVPNTAAFAFAVAARVTSLALVLSLSIVACATGTEPSRRAAAPRANVPSAIDATDALIASRPVDTASPGWKLGIPRPTPIRFPPGRRYYWMLFTNQGRMKIELLHQSAPRHVGATIYLTRLGFYDGVGFHRIIPGFMAQGGDPTGTGKGGPGFKYAGEFPRSKAPKHDERGVVSMANSGPRTDGSQFFISFKATPHLDGKHTIFGQLVEGLGTLQLIEQLGSQSGEPRRAVLIERAEIVEE